MTMNPIPPQAYTKETMLKAYSWLQNQNPSIREMATTPDILVSLFLKATRDGESALDRPSIQNFKNELKSLAHMMGELDKSTPPPAPQVAHVTAPATPTPATPPPFANLPTEPAKNQPTITEISYPNTVHMDSKSWHMIQEVKERSNLSSETEALRMLIKIGYERFKNL